MPEFDQDKSKDVLQQYSRAGTTSASSYRSLGGVSSPSQSRSASRVSTAASRKIVNRSGRRARKRSSVHRNETSGGAERGAESESDSESAHQANNEFLDFGGIDIFCDNGWDTDLESDLSAEKENKFEVATQTVYLESCKSMNVIPASYFLRHLNDTSLEMKHHGLGAVGIKPIAVALVSNTSIVKLNLEDNWLDIEGGKYVCDMLKENCYITELDLSTNRLEFNFARNFADVLVQNTTLTHVILAGNLLDDKAAEFLAEGISNTTRIEYLDLSKNRLGELGAIALGPALAENSSLRYLDLSWNNIRKKGAVAIANGLKQNILIQTLNLSWNGFANEGAKALGEALKVNSTLEELDISNNRFTAEAAVLLGKGLSVNEMLKVLKIGKNPMQSAGCYAICAAIVRNPNAVMKQLDFTDILVNEDFLELFKKVKDQFPDLLVHHGGDSLPNKPKAQLPPLTKFKNYVEKNNIKLAELFHDLEHTLIVSQSQFVKGIESLKYKITPEELQIMLDELRTNETDINYRKNLNIAIFRVLTQVFLAMDRLLFDVQELTEKEKLMSDVISAKQNGR